VILAIACLIPAFDLAPDASDPGRRKPSAAFPSCGRIGAAHVDGR
jgi:hypothetical protein